MHDDLISSILDNCNVLHQLREGCFETMLMPEVIRKMQVFEHRCHSTDYCLG